jgi:hypothetical protein
MATGQPDAPPAKESVPVYRAFREGDRIKLAVAGP